MNCNNCGCWWNLQWNYGNKMFTIYSISGRSQKIPPIESREPPESHRDEVITRIRRKRGRGRGRIWRRWHGPTDSKNNFSSHHCTCTHKHKKQSISVNIIPNPCHKRLLKWRMCVRVESISKACVCHARRPYSIEITRRTFNETYWWIDRHIIVINMEHHNFNSIWHISSIYLRTFI